MDESGVVPLAIDGELEDRAIGTGEGVVDISGLELVDGF